MAALCTYMYYIMTPTLKSSIKRLLSLAEDMRNVVPLNLNNAKFKGPCTENAAKGIWVKERNLSD